MRILVIAHVFYPELWPELAECIRNVVGCDLAVTYVDEASVTQARRDFPDASFLICENRGYDIWPFLKALKSVDLSRYDLVVKLHTKRDIELPRRCVVGYTLLNGSAWRDHLLSFVRTPDAWARTLRRFRDDLRIGMVSGRSVVFTRGDAKKEVQGGSFDAAIRLLNDEWGIPARRNGRFVGGTMFAARPEALRPFVEHPFTPEMFGVSGGHENETFAHVLERAFGLAASGLGFRVEGFDGAVFWRRFWCAIGRFFYEYRSTERRRSIRVCRITVYLRRLQN